MESTDDLSLAELAEGADVTPRTVRYYIAQGLLPAPVGQGTGARYGSTHLDRLRLIKRLQLEHLPLAAIRSRLETLDGDQIAALAQEAAPEDQVETSPVAGERALAYIRGILTKPSQPESTSTQRSFRLAEPPPPAYLVTPPPSKPSSQPPDRSTWERISITPDIELHIRRPLDRHSIKQLDQLLATARALFKRD